MPDESQDHRKLACIMFTDMVGYSALMQKNERLAIDLLEEHRQLLRSIFTKHGGKEIDAVGDGFFVEFDSALRATRCAIEIQETIHERNASTTPDKRIQVRIGIHLGDVVFRDNRVYGDGVNIAARIEPLAEPGGICITREIYDMVKHKLDVKVVSLGQKELKNIKDEIEIYEILVGAIAGLDLATLRGRITSEAKPIYKRLSTWLVSGIVLIVIGVYLFQSRSPQAPSQMVWRTVKVPSLDAYSPNISSDGNWIVYVASDAKRHLNLYIINASGGEPKKITNDTLDKMKRTPCFSPDASEIIYVQGDYYFDSATSKENFTPNIYKVPVLGGTPRQLISDAYLPIWSPDGKRIGFFRWTGPGMKCLLLAVNADGTDEKVITKSDDIFNLAWSPDSKEIAFLRAFETPTTGPYKEIFIRDLATGKERQLTDEKKMIHDVCWSSTDEIIFNPNRGETVNLSMIPATGGTPKQLTPLPGTYQGPRISRDAKRIVYVNGSRIFNLWTVSLETKEMNQITFEDGTLVGPQYSPDGKKILYYKSDDWGPGGQLFICNSDGSEPIQVTNENPGFNPPGRWSADGKAIAYTIWRKETVSTKSDSVKYTAIIMMKNLLENSVKEIGQGELMDWSPDGKYLLNRPKTDGTDQKYILSLTKSRDKPIKEIASEPPPSFSHDSRNVIYSDSVYLWTFSVDNGQTNRLRKLPKGFFGTRETADGKSIFGSTQDKNRNRHFARISKTGTQVEELFEIEGMSWGGSISPDMKTVVLSRGVNRNKIVLVDNFR